MRVLVAVGVCAAILAACANGSDGAPSLTAEPATTAAPAPTTTTLSDCEQRQVWVAEDSLRYRDAVLVVFQRSVRFGALGESPDLEDLYAVLGDYVRAYGRSRELWLRYEADAEALLRDCWREFSATYVDWQRDSLAREREFWHDEQAFCRSSREVTKTLDLPDPWALLGVSC